MQAMLHHCGASKLSTHMHAQHNATSGIVHRPARTHVYSDTHLKVHTHSRKPGLLSNVCLVRASSVFACCQLGLTWPVRSNRGGVWILRTWHCFGVACRGGGPGSDRTLESLPSYKKNKCLWEEKNRAPSSQRDVKKRGQRLTVPGDSESWSKKDVFIENTQWDVLPNTQLQLISKVLLKLFKKIWTFNL